jgi:hypothetical protein
VAFQSEIMLKTFCNGNRVNATLSRSFLATFPTSMEAKCAEGEG